MFVATLVCSRKEYIFGRTLARMAGLWWPKAQTEYFCVFDGDCRIGELWWDCFEEKVRADGAAASSVHIDLGERHENRYANVGRVRERARVAFLESDCDRLLWVECDCPPPANAIRDLARLDRPLMTAAVACRGNPTHLNQQTAVDVPGLPMDMVSLSPQAPIHRSGLGCCMMNRDAAAAASWPDDWYEHHDGIGGEDHYIQQRIGEALTTPLFFVPEVRVCHWDVNPLDRARMICHEPFRANGDARILRHDWPVADCEGAFVPRQHAWTFTQKWKQFNAGDVVPEEHRDKVVARYPYVVTNTGPELPALNLTQHEIVLPGEKVRIGGMYEAMNDAAGVTGIEKFKRGERIPPEHTAAAYNLAEIEVI